MAQGRCSLICLPSSTALQNQRVLGVILTHVCGLLAAGQGSRDPYPGAKEGVGGLGDRPRASLLTGQCCFRPVNSTPPPPQLVHVKADGASGSVRFGLQSGILLRGHPLAGTGGSLEVVGVGYWGSQRTSEG